MSDEPGARKQLAKAHALLERDPWLARVVEQAARAGELLEGIPLPPELRLRQPYVDAMPIGVSRPWKGSELMPGECLSAR